VQFSNKPESTGKPLRSRTQDGLEITLEISFQYQLQSKDLRNMYLTYGKKFHSVFVRKATDILTIVATEHNAKEFFANRAVIATNMEKQLKEHFNQDHFIGVTLFQFQAVELPGDSAKFEDAIKQTQVEIDRPGIFSFVCGARHVYHVLRLFGFRN